MHHLKFDLNRENQGGFPGEGTQRETSQVNRGVGIGSVVSQGKEPVQKSYGDKEHSSFHGFKVGPREK